MRAFHRRAVAIAVVVWTLALPSIGATQTEPEATPSPFCSVLTAEEASDALGVALSVGSSSTTDCSYAADRNVSDVNLIVQREPGPMDDVYPREYYPNGVETQVSGQEAYFSPESTKLFVDEGRDDLIFVLTLFGSTPEGIDIQVALESLAATGLPRLAGVPLPAAPTTAPEPTYVGDDELAALIPTEVEGWEVNIETYSGADLAADVDASDPDTQEFLASLQGLLATQGRTMDDLSIAYASYPTDTASGSIQAVRVRGSDISSIANDLVSLVLVDLTDAVQTPGTIAGKTVTILSDAPLDTASPDASADPFAVSQDRAYIYVNGEIVWLVAAVEPGLTEVFEQLP